MTEIFTERNFFGLKKIEDLQNDDIFDRKVIRIENYLLMLKKFE